MLMALLQLIAAHVAGVGVLVFHTYECQASRDYELAYEIMSDYFETDDVEPLTTLRLMEKIHDMGWNWQ